MALSASNLGESKSHISISSVKGLIFLDWDDTAVRGDTGLKFINNENVRNVFFTAKELHYKIFIISARHNTNEQKNNILAMLESIGVVNASNREGWALQIFCVREEGVKLSFREIAQIKKNVIINIIRQHSQVKKEKILFCDDLYLNLNTVGDTVGTICLAQPQGQHFEIIMQFMTGVMPTLVQAELEQPKQSPVIVTTMPMEVEAKQLELKQSKWDETKIKMACGFGAGALMAGSIGILAYVKVTGKDKSNNNNNPDPAPAPNFNGTRFSFLSDPDSSLQKKLTVSINSENNTLALPLELRNTLQAAARNGAVSSLLLTLQGNALTSYLTKYRWSEEKIFCAQQVLSALTMYVLTSSVIGAASLPAMTILLRNFGFETENASLIASAAFAGFNVLGTTAVQTFRAAYQFVMNPSVLGAADVLVTGAFSVAGNAARLAAGAAGSAIGYGAACLPRIGFYAAKKIFRKTQSAPESAPLKFDIA